MFFFWLELQISTATYYFFDFRTRMEYLLPDTQSEKKKEKCAKTDSRNIPFPCFFSSQINRVFWGVISSRHFERYSCTHAQGMVLLLLYAFYCWCFSLLVSLHLPCLPHAWRWTLLVKWIKGILEVQEFKWPRKILYSSLKIYYFLESKNHFKKLQENEKILL